MVFKPKGDTAQWRTVYDVFIAAPTGKTITYATLGKALHMDPVKERPRIQAAVRKAAERLLKLNEKAIEVVPGEGYRLVSASRQITLAGQQIERASSSLDRGKELTTYIALNDLNQQERQIVQTMALGFAQVAAWARQIGSRVDDHEDRLADVEAELQRIRENRDKT